MEPVRLGQLLTVAPAGCAALMASVAAMMASSLRRSSFAVRSWMVMIRSFSTCSSWRWQVWQTLFRFVRGLRTPMVRDLEGMRDMAVVAHGDGFVAAVVPTLENLAHHVTVDARLGIIGKIRQSFGIGESEPTQTDGAA